MEKLLNIEFFSIENLFKSKPKNIREFGCVLGNVRKLSMSKI
jgi:hypothetical protein